MTDGGPPAPVCVIFDLDGTLVDSETLAQQALLEVLPQLGDTVPGMVARYRGWRFANVVADLERRLGHALPADFETSYRAYAATLYESSLQPMPGAAAMLERLRAPRCIASSGPMPKMLRSLRVTGLARFFGDRLYSAYDVGVWKPDPGLFLHAAHAMGFAPEHCTVVEDSDVGLQAAARAGMRVIHYDPHAETPDDVPGLRVRHLEELPALIDPPG